LNRKDYEKAAKIVRKYRVDTSAYKINPLISSSMEDGFIELFQDDNPRFDEERFRFACNREVK
jgi:hypothetical protein